MTTVLRLAAFALLAIAAISVLLLLGWVVVSFFVAEWRPDWIVTESLFRMLGAEPAAATPAPPGMPLSRIAWVWAAACAVPLIYYLVVWRAFGRDPAAGVVFPRFSPPPGLSPGGIRHVLGMGFDGKVMAAEILSLAIGGQLTILRDEAGDYLLQRTGGSSSTLTPAERRLAASLFSGTSRVWVRRMDGARLRIAMESYRKHLEDELEGPVYATNVWAVALGIVVSGAAYLAASTTHDGEAFGTGSILMAGGFAILAAMNAGFFFWMKVPTSRGRDLLTDIAGFRMYLATAEPERLKRLEAPAMTPALYARCLPYALALDIEQEWSEHFAGVLDAAIPDPTDYEWYEQADELAFDMGVAGMIASVGGALATVLMSGDE